MTKFWPRAYHVWATADSAGGKSWNLTYCAAANLKALPASAYGALAGVAVLAAAPSLERGSSAPYIATLPHLQPLKITVTNACDLLGVAIRLAFSDYTGTSRGI
jgi:hypothetical protein